MDLKRIDKVARLGKKYQLKTIEVSENGVKIEFHRPRAVAPAAPKTVPLTKEQEKFLIKEKERLVLDEMLIMDPAAYEEIIANGQ